MMCEKESEGSSIILVRMELLSVMVIYKARVPSSQQLVSTVDQNIKCSS